MNKQRHKLNTKRTRRSSPQRAKNRCVEQVFYKYPSHFCLFTSQHNTSTTSRFCLDQLLISVPDPLSSEPFLSFCSSTESNDSSTMAPHNVTTAFATPVATPWPTIYAAVSAVASNEAEEDEKSKALFSYDDIAIIMVGGGILLYGFAHYLVWYCPIWWKKMKSLRRSQRDQPTSPPLEQNPGQTRS